MFIDNIYMLTGQRLVPDNTLITLSAKYSKLFFDGDHEQQVSLNQIAKVVDSFLARQEEYGGKDLDRWGRFDHSKSLLVKKGEDQGPIVDKLLLDVIEQLGLSLKSIWPDGKKAAVCLTHDVDLFDGRSYFFLRKMLWLYRAGLALLKGQKDTYKSYLNKLKRWSDPNYDPIYAFDKWMELEDRYGFRSTFFYFGLRHALGLDGRRYSYKNPKVRKVVKELNENGWEVGLHASYYGHLDLNYLKKQKAFLEDALGKEIIGCRHHFLRVRFPQSWDLYDKAGFKYSSNVGWGCGYNGFRAGTCLPYRPTDNNRVLEIPFHLMDSASIEDTENYHKLFLDYLNKVKAVGGCMVVDFHQEYFDKIESPGTNDAYRMILKTLSGDDELWIVPLRSVCSHINSRIS